MPGFRLDSHQAPIRVFRAAALTLPLLVLALQSPADAAVTLRFDPDVQSIPVGETGCLSVMLDDTLAFRTIEIWVEYDPFVLTSLGGSPGQLYLDSGCPLFPVFEDETPGQWYAGVVSLGPYCYPTGPGEVYRWEFEGLIDGITLVEAVEVILYEPSTARIPDVSLERAWVLCGQAMDVPGRVPLELSLHPNPFNPSTQLSFRSPVATRAEIAVFDLMGRLLGRLWSGRLGPDEVTLRWEGRDARGRSLPSGIYVFRITTQEGRNQTRKGILLK